MDNYDSNKKTDRRNFIRNSVGGLFAAGTLSNPLLSFADNNNMDHKNISPNPSNHLKSVPKITLGKTGFRVFPVIYGGIVSRNDGQLASNNYVAWSIDKGINYFDVAPIYGDAQEKLGNSLKPYRKDIYLACKTGARRRKDAEGEFEESLSLAHTDYFDVYQLHYLTNDDDIDIAFGANGVMEMLVRKQQEGSIRKLGITCHSEKIALKAMELYDFDTVMFPINWMLNKGIGWGNDICKVCREKNAGIISMKSIIQRAWFSSDERYSSSFPKSWCKPIDPNQREFRIAALKYAYQMHPQVFVPPGDFLNYSLVVDDIAEVINNPMTEAEKAFLEQEFALVKDYPFFTNE